MITTLILETRSIIHITVRFEEHHYSYLILHYLKLYYQVSKISNAFPLRDSIYSHQSPSVGLCACGELSAEKVYTQM